MTDTQSLAYMRSLIGTIKSLVGSIERLPGIGSDAGEFASSAMHKISLLELHIQTMPQQEFARRKGDRGYLHAGDTVTIQNGIVTPDEILQELDLTKGEALKPAKKAGEA